MSTWSINGTSEFPLTQPMVGQREFYYVFKSFVGNAKNAGMATIFPVIGKWGVLVNPELVLKLFQKQ